MGQVAEEPAETVMSQYVVKLTKSSGGGPASAAGKKRGESGHGSAQEGRQDPSTMLASGLASPGKIDLQFAPDEEEVNRFTASRGIRGPRAGGSTTFKKKLGRLRHLYKDQNYQEADGLYFVYHGTVDILNPRNRECLYQMGITDNFGESKILRRPAFEYMGDLYAGLQSKGRVTGKLIPNIPYHDHSAPLAQPINFGSLAM